MSVDNGGPAFPTMGDEFMQTGDGSWHPKSEYGMQGMPGMSLRDYFAGQALNGMLSYSMNDSCGNWVNSCSESRVAGHAYEYADAMLAARATGSAVQS